MAHVNLAPHGALELNILKVFKGFPSTDSKVKSIRGLALLLIRNHLHDPKHLMPW